MTLEKGTYVRIQQDHPLVPPLLWGQYARVEAENKILVLGWRGLPTVRLDLKCVDPMQPEEVARLFFLRNLQLHGEKTYQAGGAPSSDLDRTLQAYDDAWNVLNKVLPYKRDGIEGRTDIWLAQDAFQAAKAYGFKDPFTIPNLEDLTEAWGLLVHASKSVVFHAQRAVEL